MDDAKPMSDERLAEIRRAHSGTDGVAAKLLAEVVRLRKRLLDTAGAPFALVERTVERDDARDGRDTALDALAKVVAILTEPQSIAEERENDDAVTAARELLKKAGR